MNKVRKRISPSRFIILFIAAFWIYVFFNNRQWTRNHVVWDVVSYYAYNPALFVYHDLSLKFIEKDPNYFGDKFWPETAHNGGKVVKTTMGISFLYAPFFLVGHVFAKITGAPLDGFSTPYQTSVFFSCLFYLMLGMYFLRKVLLCFFSETVSSIVLLCIYFGTNLLWYSIFEGMVSHGYLFSLLSAMMYFTIRWHEKPTMKYSIILGMICGLCTLIRPTIILFCFFPLLYNVYNIFSFQEKIQTIRIQWKYILACVLAFMLTGLPQLIYWKYITGHWFFYSYGEEIFFFDNPQLIQGLFGFRKGWFIYTPVMILACIGMFFLFKDTNLKILRLAVIVPILISLYVILSWWSWWYGGSFGMRACVDFYGILALPMAVCVQKFLNISKVARALFVSLLFILISFNLFQTWQYKNGLIHYDGMTWEAYRMNLFKKHHTTEWWLSLRRPNYTSAVKGISESVIKKLDFEETESSGCSSPISKEGNKSFKLQNDCEFSPAFKHDLVGLREMAKEIRVEAWFYLTEPIQKNTLFLVQAIEKSNGEVYQYNARDLSDLNLKLFTWNKVTYDIDVPDKPLYNNDKFNVYAWNKNPVPVYVDAIIISMLE